VACALRPARSEDWKRQNKIAAAGSPGQPQRRRGAIRWGVLLTLWGLVLGVGFLGLTAYASWPGDSGRAPSDWPRDCGIPLDSRRDTLVMFLHPLCPCSRASVDELLELAARSSDRVAVHLVSLHTDYLARSGLTRVDRAGVTSWDDAGGKLAQRFGVLTSGHVLLYEPGGRLVYSGGITPLRGHRGDNPGRRAVLDALCGGSENSATGPVFGCPLFDPRSTQAEQPCP
jgi:hypothetical protein